MRILNRILNCSLTPAPIDLWLLRLSGYATGIGVLVLVALVLPRHAANRTELYLGLGLACLNCVISMMFATLSVRLNRAAQAGKLPWQSRIWEWASYSAGIAILILGMWFTATFPLGRAGFISAFLLILAMTLATFCLGILVTLTLGRQPGPANGACPQDGV